MSALPSIKVKSLQLLNIRYLVFIGSHGRFAGDIRLASGTFPTFADGPRSVDSVSSGAMHSRVDAGKEVEKAKNSPPLLAFVFEQTGDRRHRSGGPEPRG